MSLLTRHIVILYTLIQSLNNVIQSNTKLKQCNTKLKLCANPEYSRKYTSHQFRDQSKNCYYVNQVRRWSRGWRHGLQISGSWDRIPMSPLQYLFKKILSFTWHCLGRSMGGVASVTSSTSASNWSPARGVTGVTAPQRSKRPTSGRGTINNYMTISCIANQFERH